MEPNRTAIVLRAAGATAITSIFAPAICSVLLLGFLAIWRPSQVGAPELVGLTVWAVMLGMLPTIACCVPALLCVWLARRFNIASLSAFAAGGAVLALGEWTAIAARDVVEWNFRVVIDAADLIIVLVLTGAIFGSLWWVMLGRPLSLARGSTSR